MRQIDAKGITRERTEEERLRRHLHGDKGATFSKGKYMTLGSYDYVGCVTTFFTKDNLTAIIYETN